MGAGGLRAAMPGCQKRERKLGSGVGGKGEPGSSPAAHPSPTQPAGQEGATPNPASPRGGTGCRPPPGRPPRGPGTSWKEEVKGRRREGPREPGRPAGGDLRPSAWLGTGLSIATARARARMSGGDKVISSEVFQNCPDLRCLYFLGYFWAHVFWLGPVALLLKVTAIPAQGVVRREN